jgi:hypothetical protein
MWGIFAGIALWLILYPLIEEWQQRRLDKQRLANMRRHFSLGHRWDALQGRWVDD